MGARLLAALQALECGFSVFPLHYPKGGQCSCGQDCSKPAKHPFARFVPNGKDDATRDEEIVRRWWSSVPDANIGIIAPDIFALDVDPRHGGDTALAELEDGWGPLPLTWRVETGGGGEHIFFRAPPRLRLPKQLATGIDLKGCGSGYVVAPGSLHISGKHYCWVRSPDRIPLATAPDWVLALIGRWAHERERPVADDLRGGVNEGGRNIAISQLCGMLLGRQIDAVLTFELCQAWNAVYCTPPLREEEVTRVVESIARRELRHE